MRTKLISSYKENNVGFKGDSWDKEVYEYECACGESKIVEEYTDIDGSIYPSVYICCQHCKENYELDTSKGIRSWDLVKTFSHSNLTKKLTLDIIRSSWKTVLDKIKEKRLMILYASIVTGTLTDYNSDNNTLTITYNQEFKFNADRLSTLSRYYNIIEVLAEIFDTEIKVIFEVAEEDNAIIEDLVMTLNLHNDTESLEITNTISPISTFAYNTIDELYLYTLKQLNLMPYDKYLKTEHWKHFRNEAVIHFNAKCALCNKTSNLNVHHKDYKNRGRETFNDVILLCEECHNGHHKIKR